MSSVELPHLREKVKSCNPLATCACTRCGMVKPCHLLKQCTQDLPCALALRQKEQISIQCVEASSIAKSQAVRPWKFSK